VLARESVNRWRGRRWREVTTDVVPETTHHDSTDRTFLLDDLRRLPPLARLRNQQSGRGTSQRLRRENSWS
jgi:hypothetical protein